eukprot:1254445-Rhodomonas_salina.1
MSGADVGRTTTRHATMMTEEERKEAGLVATLSIRNYTPNSNTRNRNFMDTDCGWLYWASALAWAVRWCPVLREGMSSAGDAGEARAGGGSPRDGQ